MATKKKSGFIPKVDAIKAGIDITKDPYEKYRNEDGFIVIHRSKKGQEIKERVAVANLAEQEKKLEQIKKEISKLELNKKDIKNIKEDIKEKSKKKKKKDKKKKKNRDSYMEALIDAVPSDLAQYISEGGEKGLKKKKKKDKKKKKNRDKLKGLEIKEKKKKTVNKDKSEKEDKSKSEVAARFKEVEKITRENIKEIDSTMAYVDERIKDIMKSSERVRGKDTALANYFAAKTSLISTRQKAATDILSNRAKVYDIEMKKEKSASSSAASDADIIARIFPGIAMNGSMDKNTKEYIANTGKNKNGKKKKKKEYKSGGGFFYEDDDDALSKREKELIKSGDIEYSDYDKNIEWEGKFNVAIKKAWTDNEWKFIAVDDDGNVIKDVPKSMLPSKKSAKLKFDDEIDVATDINSNKTYKVYPVPRI